jgi:hypothetical protein
MGTETAQEILTRDIMALGASLWPARAQTFDQARSLLFIFKEEGLLPKSTLGRRDNAVKIASNIIAGVEFLHVQQFDADGNITKAVPNPITPVGLGIDVRFAVFMVRLTKLLKRKFSVDTIYHIGFITGNRDAHGAGRAFDFVGARGRSSGSPFSVNVFRHWKRQPVTMPEDFGTIKQGARLEEWPADFHNTVFRLRDNPNLDPTRVGSASELTLARDLFEEVYDFSARQVQDTETNDAPPTKIGTNSSFIIHPDYKKVSSPAAMKNGRDAHFQHIHIQLGFR